MIPQGYYWLNIVLLAIGTIAIRGSIIALSTRAKISERLKELFTFIPAAILPAFIAPAVFFHQGDVSWVMGKERVVVLILAAILCWVTRSTLATVGFGLVALYLFTNF
ncbi:MAG: AzlD domain-containing protein [Bdellovibrionota bacterium]